MNNGRAIIRLEGLTYEKRILSFLLALALLIPMVPQLTQPASAESYEIVTADSSMYPESNHNYANNLYETKTFSYPGAEKLSVTFSTKTYVSDFWGRIDNLYLYDGNGILIATYTGTAAAGVTVEIPGDTFQIKLVSDSIFTEYGYSFDPIAKDPTELSVGSSLYMLCAQTEEWSCDFFVQ